MIFTKAERFSGCRQPCVDRGLVLAPLSGRTGRAGLGEFAVRHVTDHRAKHAAFLIFVFLISFGVSGAFLGGVVPRPGVPGVSAKLEELKRRGEEVDVLFVGTSRVHHQIIPRLFDRLTAEAGCPTHSFNLGVDGLRTPEDYFVLEKALEGRTRPLRWIILECKDISFLEREVECESVRGPYWHDCHRMGILTQRFFAGRSVPGLTFKQNLRSARDEVHVLAKHAFLWLENELSVGASAERTASLALPEIGDLGRSSKKPINDGYLSQGNPPVASDEIVTYTRKLEELRKHPAVAEYGDRTSQRVLRLENALAARHGAKLVLLVPPTLKPRKFLPDPALLPIPTVIDVDRPEEYPELFDLQNRRDETHLNERGAEIFTTILAKRLCRLGTMVSVPAEPRRP